MPTSPYSSQTISGFNASPPADDGSAVSANQLEWDKHKTKLADPIKTLAEAINTQMVTAGTKLINTDNNENNSMGGALAFAGSELTISAGSITVTRTHHDIDTQSDASTDDLDNATTGSVSDHTLLFLRANNTARTVVIKHEASGAGQFHNAANADVSLDDTDKIAVYIRLGADWYQIVPPVGLQADLESASESVLVTANLMQHHPGVAKAWVQFSLAGALTSSYNVTSVTDSGAGDWTVNWATDFSSGAYGVQVSVDYTGSIDSIFIHGGPIAAGTYDVNATSSGTTKTDSSITSVMVVAHGDQ